MMSTVLGVVAAVMVVRGVIGAMVAVMMAGMVVEIVARAIPRKVWVQIESVLLLGALFPTNCEDTDFFPIPHKKAS